MVTTVDTRPVGQYTQGSSIGVILLGTCVVAVGAALINPLYGFAPFALLLILWAIKWTGVLAYAPTKGIPLLYFAIIFVTCVAPAIGGIGTLARVALGGLALVALLASSRADDRKFPPLAAWALVVFCGALLVATVGGASLNYGVARLLNAALFIPLVILAFRRPHTSAIAFATIATCVFQMIGVALQYIGVLGGTWGGLLLSGTTYDPTTSTWLRRYTGFIQNPNNLALLLALGVIVLAACITAALPLRLKAFMLVLMGVFTYGIILTGSRGGLVAAGLGLLVLLLARGVRGWFAGAALVAGAYVVSKLTQWQALDRLIQSFSEIIAGTDVSARQRSAVWVDRFATSDSWTILTGQGFGGYASALFERQSGFDIDPEAARSATVDNAWLKLQLESGVAGTLPLALLVILAVVGAFYASKKGNRVLGVASAAAIVAMLWRSTTVDMLDQNPWNAIFFLAIGLALSSTAPRLRQNDPHASSMRPGQGTR